MKNTLLLFLFLLLSVPEIYSQNSFEINFGTVNQDLGYSIKQANDGKYIVTGSTASLVNGNDDVYIALIDTNGNVLWTKSYGGSLNDYGNDIIQTADSGFVIAGATYSYGNGMMDVYLIKTDRNGDTLWTKTFGGSEYDFANAIETTFDGGLILVGQESSSGAGIAHIYMIKTDAAGDTLWTKSFPLAAWAGAIGVVQTADSGFMVFGDYENNITGLGDYDLVCIRTNSSGDSLWSKTYEDTVYHDFAQAICATNDSGFVILSQRDPYLILEYASSKILKLDANGDTLWTKVFGGAFNCTMGDIYQTSDSGYIITGFTYDTVLTKDILFIAKLNSVGDSLWFKYYDGLFTSAGNSIQATTDGGIVVCGNTADSILNDANVYVIKTDGNGDIFYCQQVILTQPTNAAIFENHDAVYVLSASQQSSVYQWQTDSAGVFVDIHDTGVFSGTDTSTLQLTVVPLTMDGNLFRCVVTDSSGCTDTSIVVSLQVNSSIGITEPSFNRAVIYPNPATDRIFISGILPDHIILYDVIGNSIAQYNGLPSIDISSLPKGVYYLKLYTANGNSFVNRFLKN